jgi:hypothetical protein
MFATFRSHGNTRYHVDSFPPRRLVTPAHAQVKEQVATTHHIFSSGCRVVVEDLNDPQPTRSRDGSDLPPRE